MLESIVNGNQAEDSRARQERAKQGVSETKTEKTSLLNNYKIKAMDEKNESFLGRPKMQNYCRKVDFLQVFLCVISNTAVLSSGMTLGFTSVALPFLVEPNDVLNVTMNEASWIASIANIATPIGCLISGPILDTFGRKVGLLIINVPAFTGWLLIAINPNLTRVYFGRFLTGLAAGLSSIPATVYMAETSTASLRGLLVNGTSVAISLGVAIVYGLGLFLQENWRLVAAICAVFPVISAILTFLLLPESPVWLLTHGRPERAKKTLMKIRGLCSDFVQMELEAMEEQAKINVEKTSFTNAVKALRKPESYKPLLLMNLFFLFQQLTGVFVVIFYAVAVVKEAGITIDPFIVAFFIGLTRLLFSVVAAWMSRTFGRRPTALMSGIGMTVSLMVLATQLLLQQHGSTIGITLNSPDSDTNSDENPLNFLPVIMIITYISASTIGFLTLPWAMIGEVFPLQTRGIASGFTTSMAYVFSFIAVKLYPYMMIIMERYGVFYFYGMMALAGTTFVFFFLPETQGKTLIEIEKYFAGKRGKVENSEEEVLNRIKMVPIVKTENT